MVINTVYDIGETVYLRVRSEKVRGMVTAVLAQSIHTVRYQVSWANDRDTWHEEFELSSEFVPDFSTVGGD